MKRGLRLVVVAAFGLLLADCSANGGQSPATHSPSVRSSAGAAITLADRRTVDPCGLIPLAVLQKFGRVTEGQSGEGLLRCEVSILMADGGEAGLGIQIDTKAMAAKDIKLHDLVVEERPAGLRIVRSRYENVRNVEQCVHELDFADQTAIDVGAYAPSNLASDDFCMIGKAALAAVVATVTSGNIRHRTWPAGTLAGRPDLCGMVTRDVRALVPALATAKLEKSPSGIDCTWRMGDLAGLRWTVGVTTMKPIAGAPRPYEKHAQIAGRRTTLIDLYPGSCTATTPGCPLGVAMIGGAPLREQAEITVSAPSAPTDLCDMAGKVAARMWPKLPKV